MLQRNNWLTKMSQFHVIESHSQLITKIQNMLLLLLPKWCRIKIKIDVKSTF